MESGGLSVEVAQFEGEVVIALSGEADLAAIEQLRDAIEPHVAPQQTIALDLSGLTFLDSSFLNVLVRARGELRERGGKLLLRNPSDVALRVLTMTDLTDLVDTEVDRQDET